MAKKLRTASLVNVSVLILVRKSVKLFVFSDSVGERKSLVKLNKKFDYERVRCLHFVSSKFKFCKPRKLHVY